MLNVSTLQLLYVWDELHAALRGEGSGGGPIAQIETYRVMPAIPEKADAREIANSYAVGASTLGEIAMLFEHRLKANVMIEAEPESGRYVSFSVARYEAGFHDIRRIRLKVTRRL